MTRDDIIKMAEDVGLFGLDKANLIDKFESFAALVAAATLKANQWRPIADAPKNGARVLTIANGVVQHIICYSHDGIWYDADHQVMEDFNPTFATYMMAFGTTQTTK